MRGLIIIPLAFLIFGCLGDYNSDHFEYIHDHPAAAHFNDLAQRLYQSISENVKGNFVFSPMSVSIGLSMLLKASCNSTHDELVQLLFHGGGELDVHEYVKPLIEEFNNFTMVDLKLTNKIFLSDKIILNPQFNEDAAFNGFPEMVAFRNRTGASKQINEWCEKQTNSKIKNIVSPNDIDDHTLMVLLNAVYFKGNWAKKFEQSNTNNLEFHLENGTTKYVPTMFTLGDYHVAYSRELRAKIIRLPYENADKNDDLSMYIIVPDNSSTLQNLESKVLNLELFNLSLIRTEEIQLWLPKFKIESSIDLKSPLMKLGLKNIFTQEANFEGLTSSKVVVSKFSQKAFIEVNEEGSEAAAITNLIFGDRFGQDPTEFRVDRPFLSLIATNHSILFMARVVDP